MEKKTLRGLTQAGMTISLACLVWTALGKGKRSMRLHTCAGISLVGFSVWHYNTYQKADKSRTARKSSP